MIKPSADISETPHNSEVPRAQLLLLETDRILVRGACSTRSYSGACASNAECIERELVICAHLLKEAVNIDIIQIRMCVMRGDNDLKFDTLDSNGDFFGVPWDSVAADDSCEMAAQLSSFVVVFNDSSMT